MHAVKLDGKTVTPKHLSGNKHYVEVSGIGVASLENRHAVTFDDAYTVELDALSYVHAVLAGGGQPGPLKELVRAFYAYDRAFNGSEA